MIISPEQLVDLPLHDSEIYVLSIETAENGFLRVCLIIKIIPAESAGQFAALGFTGEKLRIVFKDCWRIKTDLVGHSSNHGCVDTVELVADSELKKELLDHGLGNQGMSHFKIKDSKGSVLEIVTESVWMGEQ